MPGVAPVGSVAVLGAAGRMGTAIIRLVSELPELALTAAVEHAKSDKLGMNAAQLAGAVAPGGVSITAVPPAPGVAAVWIDFSSPEATASNAAAAAAAGAALVVGTTGVSATGKQAQADAARTIPVFFAANTSVGVTVLLQLCAEAARLLGPGFDLEVVETHHRRKRDAPSGTALRLAEALAEATGRDLAKDARTARVGDVGPRTQQEIGIQAVRGGDVIGDHTVFFLGDGERVEITHRASSRETFARGALRAARWVVGRPPGLYDMRDVLGLKA